MLQVSPPLQIHPLPLPPPRLPRLAGRRGRRREASTTEYNSVGSNKHETDRCIHTYVYVQIFMCDYVCMYVCINKICIYTYTFIFTIICIYTQVPVNQMNERRHDEGI